MPEVDGELRHRLFRAALRLLGGNKDDADDAVQDVLLRVQEHRSTFRGEASLSTWAHRILLNLCTDRGRRSWTRCRVLDHPPETEDAACRSPERLCLSREMGEQLAVAFAGLKACKRAALVLWLNDATQAEIAKTLGLSKATAATHVFRARRELRERLQHLAA